MENTPDIQELERRAAGPDRYATVVARLPGLLDPTWFNTVRFNGAEGVVLPDGQSIEVRKKVLQLDSPLPAGESVVLTLGRNFECALKRDIEAVKDSREARSQLWQIESQRRAAEALVQHEKTRTEFWQANTPPFPFHVAHFEMLSGLSEGSRGNGTTRASVLHVVTEDSFELGRLKRGPKEALCGAKSSARYEAPWLYREGNDNSWAPLDNTDPNFKPEKPTCTKCCGLLERIVADKAKQAAPTPYAVRYLGGDDHRAVAEHHRDGKVVEQVPLTAATKAEAVQQARAVCQLAGNENMSLARAAAQLAQPVKGQEHAR